MAILSQPGAAEIERLRAHRQRSYEVVGRKLALLVRQYEERHGSIRPAPSEAPVDDEADAQSS